MREHFLSTCRATTIALQVAIVCCPITTSEGNKFHVAKSRNTVYFLQHENLLCAEVVIRQQTIATCNAIAVANYNTIQYWRDKSLSSGLFRTNLQHCLGDFSHTACYAVYN